MDFNCAVCSSQFCDTFDALDCEILVVGDCNSDFWRLTCMYFSRNMCRFCCDQACVNDYSTGTIVQEQKR
jgi:hypothetical protein